MTRRQFRAFARCAALGVLFSAGWLSAAAVDGGGRRAPNLEFMGAPQMIKCPALATPCFRAVLRINGLSLRVSAGDYLASALRARFDEFDNIVPFYASAVPASSAQLYTLI